MLLLSGGVLGAAVLLREDLDHSMLSVWDGVFSLFLGGAFVFLVFGGLVRPLQKKAYHGIFEASDHFRGRLAVNPVMRWLLWLDNEGRDRDA